MVAGRVPVLLTTKSDRAEALIMIGLKNTTGFVDVSGIVVSPEIYENTRLDPKPRARRLNVSEPMVRRPVKSPGRGGTNVTVNVKLAFGARMGRAAGRS